jgi:hypothetical protein
MVSRWAVVMVVVLVAVMVTKLVENWVLMMVAKSD